jgi:hypothetical protein
MPQRQGLLADLPVREGEGDGAAAAADPLACRGLRALLLQPRSLLGTTHNHRSRCELSLGSCACFEGAKRRELRGLLLETQKAGPSGRPPS